jgi:hypothetical protein
MKKKECKTCEALRHVILDIWWMARRYADGRYTYAPSMYNEAINLAIKNGVVILNPDNVAKPPSIYAKDGE